MCGSCCSEVLPIRGIRSEDEGRISLRISCITVMARSTVILKLSFSPPVSEIRKEAKSRLRKKRTGRMKLTRYRTGRLCMEICNVVWTEAKVSVCSNKAVK